jgi:hypothetical protein
MRSRRNARCGADARVGRVRLAAVYTLQLSLISSAPPLSITSRPHHMDDNPSPGRRFRRPPAYRAGVASKGWNTLVVSIGNIVWMSGVCNDLPFITLPPAVCRLG